MVEKKGTFLPKSYNNVWFSVNQSLLYVLCQPIQFLIPRMNVLRTTKRVTFLHKTAFLNYRDFQEKGLGPPLLLVRGLVVE